MFASAKHLALAVVAGHIHRVESAQHAAFAQDHVGQGEELLHRPNSGHTLAGAPLNQTCPSSISSAPE